MFRSALEEIHAEFGPRSLGQFPTGVPIPGEVGLILETIQPNPRDYLISRILYFAGLRRHELVALVPGDVLWDLRSLFILAGKGDKDRYVVLDQVTLQLLHEWIQSTAPEGRIFPITVSRLSQVFQAACKKCGLYQKYHARRLRLSPHSMRHAFATHRYQNGMNFWSLLALMGHAYADTTLIYLRTAKSQIDGAYARSNPFRPASQVLTGRMPPEPRDLGDGPEPPTTPDWPEAKELAIEFALQPQAARPNGLPYGPTPLEMTLLLQESRADSGHYLVVRLLYATGMWLHELLNLQAEDILWEERHLLVSGRLVCLDEESLKLLRECPPGAPLFTMTPEQAEQMIRHYATKTGLAPRIQCRAPFGADAIRYAFATHCCLNGMDLLSLMNLLGHQFLSTTNVYVRCAAARFLPEYDAAACPGL